jgi:uncharacterized protein involved in type VI secretion and phage assembly
VLVDFVENDIDRPVVVAQLYTGRHAPPFAAGADWGVNLAATISGIHTPSIDGGGYNIGIWTTRRAKCACGWPPALLLRRLTWVT